MGPAPGSAPPRLRAATAGARQVLALPRRPLPGPARQSATSGEGLNAKKAIQRPHNPLQLQPREPTYANRSTCSPLSKCRHGTGARNAHSRFLLRSAAEAAANPGLAAAVPTRPAVMERGMPPMPELSVMPPPLPFPCLLLSMG